MTSKPKQQSGRAGFPLRMESELKKRLDRAAEEDGMSLNNWILSALEEVLAYRDAKGAAEKKKAAREHYLEMKFEEIVSLVATRDKVGDRAKLASEKQIELEEKAQSAIEDWRNRRAVDHYARPRTPLEQLCSDFLDIETEIQEGIPEDRSGYFQIQIDDADPDDDEIDDAGADDE
jgi:hypothetical protein